MQDKDGLTIETPDDPYLFWTTISPAGDERVELALPIGVTVRAHAREVGWDVEFVLGLDLDARICFDRLTFERRPGTSRGISPSITREVPLGDFLAGAVRAAGRVYRFPGEASTGSGGGFAVGKHMPRDVVERGAPLTDDEVRSVLRQRPLRTTGPRRNSLTSAKLMEVLERYESERGRGGGDALQRVADHYGQARSTVGVWVRRARALRDQA